MCGKRADVAMAVRAEADSWWENEEADDNRDDLAWDDTGVLVDAE